MALENSPSLKEYGKGLPPRPRERGAMARRLGIVIAGVLIVVLGVSAITLLQSDQAAGWFGVGTITGVVVDDAGKPVAAQVFVLKPRLQAQTDARGAFEIRGVPAGQRAVAVVRDGSGTEYPAVVTTGDTTNLGEIKYLGTRVPGQ